ncbi:MAG: DUF3597 domain-containing protein [Beijerinckiaceae bacterium]|nr:DUF3597 domain-containing protein [Beijerinckiaceae bacterium]
MSIFGTIMAKVFGQGAAAQPAAVAVEAPVANAPAADAPAAAPVPNEAPADAAAAPATAPAEVDVAAILDGMDDHGQDLDWRKSIVDLMKLLGLDSSLAARKQLAEELHFDGDEHDSAAMNIWLHEQVMTKFAENGGKLPADLH